MHSTRIRNILWMLKRNGYKAEVSSTKDTDGHPHHTITAIDATEQRWTVTGNDMDTIIAELLQQLGSHHDEDSN